MIEQATEWVCVAKTVRRLYPAVEALIKRLHSHETPEILAVPVVAGSAGYLDWVNAQVLPRRARQRQR